VRFAGLLLEWRFFFPPPGSLLSGAPQPSILSKTEPTARNGLSLARNGFRSHGYHSGVNVSGLPLRGPPGGFQARSAFSSAAVSVCP
jgi:hypothetical protein